MPLLPALDLRFSIRVEGLAPDLPFLGPTVRGLLGYGLRQHCCGHTPLDDGRCPMGDACAYAFLFEGPLQRRLQDEGIAVDALPQPFVVLVDPPCASRAPLQRISFGIRLLGTAIALAPAVVAAIRCRERYGFGARSLGFTLESIAANGAHLWTRAADPAADTLEESARRAATQCSSGTPAVAACAIPPGDTMLRWRFRTPIALGLQQVPPAELPAVLLTAAARRAWLLERAYGEQRLLQRSLPARVDASRFTLLERQLTSFRLDRRSTRHGRKVSLRGELGTAAIRGPWDQHAALIESIRRYGVGQCTSFGFGQVALEFESVDARDPDRPPHAPPTAQQPDPRRPLAENPPPRFNAPRWVRLRGAPPPKRLPKESTPPSA